MEQMTPEHAIQEIQYYMNHDSYIDAPSNDACKLAIDALKKQVPKKPARHDWTTPAGITLYEYNCSKCDESMEEEWKLCPYCGQALDWTE